MKIWWQSSTPLGKSAVSKEYETALAQYLKSIKRPDVELTLSGVDRSAHALEDNYGVLLNTASPGGVLSKIILAERDGFDGVAIGCFLDPALYEAREIVDIPVLGLCETSLHVASMLGKRFSVIAFADKQQERYERAARAYGLGDKMAPFGSISIDSITLLKSITDPGKIIQLFETAANKAVEAGAEVIIPGCGCLDLIMARKNIREIDGALVLPCDATLLKITEAMVDLSKLGVKVSRKMLFASVSKQRLGDVLSTYWGA